MLYIAANPNEDLAMSTHKKKISLRAAFLFALPLTFGLAGLAVAHPGGSGGPGKGAHKGPPTAQMQQCRAEHKAKKLAKVDTNKDGTASPEERKAAHEARRAARLAEYDKDQSGDLSEAERKEARHDRMVETFEALDTDSNAEISSAEAEASCSPASRHFDKVDADGSGSVTWAEFEGAAKKFMKRGGKRGHRGMKGHRGQRGPDGKRGHRGMRGGSPDSE